MAIRKSFLHEIGGVASFGGTNNQFTKVLSVNIIHETFLPRKFPTIPLLL